MAAFGMRLGSTELRETMTGVRPLASRAAPSAVAEGLVVAQPTSKMVANNVCFQAVATVTSMADLRTQRCHPQLGADCGTSAFGKDYAKDLPYLPFAGSAQPSSSVAIR